MGTSDGFFPVVCRWWPAIVEALQASGEPWPEEAAKADLRWWSDFVRMKPSEVSFPGRRKLAKRWKWKPNDARKLLEARDEWEDPRFGEESHPVATRSTPGRHPVENGSPDVIEEDSPGRHPVPTRSSPTLSTLSTENTPPSRVRAPAPPREEPALFELEASPEEDPDDVSPRWVKLWTRGPGRRLSVQPEDVFASLNRSLEEIRGKIRVPSESASRPVLRLWKEALETQRAKTLEDLEELVARLARACRECPDEVFRNDVRGERVDGSSWKKDTSRTPSMVCRLAAKSDSSGSSWEDRLDVEERWALEGYPRTTSSSSPTPKRSPRRGGPSRSAADRLLQEL